MSEYRIGKQRTRRDQRTSVVIHVTVPRRIFDRLNAMRQALQRDIGPDVDISIASIARRILYQHPSLKRLAHRHYELDTGDDIVT
jgi:hypothetical protein